VVGRGGMGKERESLDTFLADLRVWSGGRVVGC
jgi:hypothetical protein